MERSKIRKYILEAGVKNLKVFGYSDVTTENILTDEIYKEFFKEMLNSNVGESPDSDDVINELLTQIS